MDDLSDVTPPADELNDERYPSLYNISPAFLYRFIPVPMGERRQVLESGGRCDFENDGQRAELEQARGVEPGSSPSPSA
jgi:hypothetical protein